MQARMYMDISRARYPMCVYVFMTLFWLMRSLAEIPSLILTTDFGRGV